MPKPLHCALFDTLRAMDAEADNLVDGHRTGLRWFNRFLRPDYCPTERTEEAWTDGLVPRLWQQGLPALREVTYPAPCNRNWSCDLVVGSAADAFTWIEVKGAWQHLRHPDGLVTANPSYAKHLLRSTAADFAKLLAVRRPHAHAVGVLLIGFDHESTPMDVAVTGMAREAAVGWDAPETDTWPDRTVVAPGYRVRCWWWARAAPA